MQTAVAHTTISWLMISTPTTQVTGDRAYTVGDDVIPLD